MRFLSPVLHYPHTSFNSPSHLHVDTSCLVSSLSRSGTKSTRFERVESSEIPLFLVQASKYINTTFRLSRSPSFEDRVEWEGNTIAECMQLIVKHIVELCVSKLDGNNLVVKKQRSENNARACLTRETVQLWLPAWTVSSRYPILA